MPRNIIFSPEAPPPPPSESQPVRAGGPIFVWGTAPIDPATSKTVEGGAGAQTALCLRNIAEILSAGGSSLDNVVSATQFEADTDDFTAIRAEWMRWFPTHPPARQVAKIAVRIAGIKVSVIAKA